MSERNGHRCRFDEVNEEFDLVIWGGAGHVGLPLAITFASLGQRVGIYDISLSSVELISQGRMPFLEPGAEDLLKAAVESGLLLATTDDEILGRTDTIFVVIGTPLDSQALPQPDALLNALEEKVYQLRDGQMIVLRSTVYPGVSQSLNESVLSWGKEIDLVFAPERILEHNAIKELRELPQIVSGFSDRGLQRATDLFSLLGVDVVVVEPFEAELAKLFTNAWRYIKFAVANQFFEVATSAGASFEAIRDAMIYEYPRAKDFPSAGFAAGPCLYKDTVQLATYFEGLSFGQLAIDVNTGLPEFLVAMMEAEFPLSRMNVGLLGMSFKANSDDVRDSLSYRLKELLSDRAKSVVAADPFVKSEIDSEIFPLENVLERSDIIVIATPHDVYKELSTSLPVVDIWGVTKSFQPEISFADLNRDI